jgi:hypothetical protein
MSPVRKPEFSKSGPAAEPRLAADENPPNLKMFEREDWTLFRTIDGLMQKAGVPAKHLRRLVLKELADNALDTGTAIRFGQVDVGQVDGSPDKFYVEDRGPGLDGTPEQIAELFSIRRPMRSTKLLRLPQRGALGNGLRVAAAAVFASEGSLVVTTRNRRIVLRPHAHGHTAVVNLTGVEHQAGTRIEIGFGLSLPRDSKALMWVQRAAQIAGVGNSYEGRSSPYWYDGGQFHELLLAYGAQPVRGLIAELDGCSGGKAGEIVAAAGLERLACDQINRAQAIRLLMAAREQARPVSPDRLGGIGRDGYPDAFYAVERGTVELGTVKPLAEIPFVIEVWAQKRTSNSEVKFNDALTAILTINRTPTIDELIAWRDGDKDLRFSGSGLDGHYGSDAPKKGAYFIVINVTTPYCPIISDGKAPDLAVFADRIFSAAETAMRKAQRAAPEDKVSQRDVVIDNLAAVIAKVSGDGRFRFNSRQLLYRLRPIVREATGQALRTKNFNSIITDYENENGEIPGMYRDPRGSIYHPHRRETIPLGTLAVEEYERPIWTYNKLLHIEKEGWSEALKAVNWAERHDCVLTSTKGFATRAIRDLFDKLAEHDEPVTIFLVTDADAYGTMIYQTFQEATKARGARKIKIVHLGLHPWEAVALGLEVEELDEDEDENGKRKRKAVADYVKEREDLTPTGETWEEWLQTHRIELNAMTTPEFIAWLDDKMAEHGDGKLIPPKDVIAAELEEHLAVEVRAAVRERILREAGFDDQVAEVLAAIKRPGAAALVTGIKKLFARTPEAEWRAYIARVAAKLRRAAP